MTDPINFLYPKNITTCSSYDVQLLYFICFIRHWNRVPIIFASEQRNRYFKMAIIVEQNWYPDGNGLDSKFTGI